MRRGNFILETLKEYRAALIGLAFFTLLILAGHVQDLRSLLASTTASMGWVSESIIFFTAYEDAIAPGDAMKIDVRVNAATPINVVGTTIRFDPEALEIMGFSKEASFLNLWTEETIIDEKAGQIRLSGGTVQQGGHKGPGTVITLVVRAKKEGPTELSFSASQVFANDGKGTTVPLVEKPYAFTVAAKTEGAPVAASTPVQSADFNDDGKVTLADVSIFAVQLLSNYHTRYDLNRDGRMDLGDLSVVFTSMNSR